MGHGVVQIAGEREPFLLADQLSGAFLLDVVKTQHQAADEGQGQFQHGLVGEVTGIRVPQHGHGEHADGQGHHDHRCPPGRAAAHRHGEENQQADEFAAAALAGRHVHGQQAVGHRGHEGAGAGHQRGPRGPNGNRASRPARPSPPPGLRSRPAPSPRRMPLCRRPGRRRSVPACPRTRRTGTTTPVPRSGSVPANFGIQHAGRTTQLFAPTPPYAPAAAITARLPHTGRSPWARARRSPGMNVAGPGVGGSPGVLASDGRGGPSRPLRDAPPVGADRGRVVGVDDDLMLVEYR